MPDVIIGDAYTIIKTTLIGYKKSAAQWDDYSKKLDSSTQDILKRAFYECRCNGFFNPHVINDEIVFDQIIKRTHNKDKWPLTVNDMKAV